MRGAGGSSSCSRSTSKLGSCSSTSMQRKQASALDSAAKPASSGLPSEVPTPSTSLTFALVSGSSAGNDSPLRSAASSISPLRPPENDTAPSRGPVGGDAWVKYSTVSTTSSSVSTRTTPMVSATASKQSSEPASDPVCASAALRLSSEPPIFTATTGLPASRAAAQAVRNSSA